MVWLNRTNCTGGYSPARLRSRILVRTHCHTGKQGSGYSWFQGKIPQTPTKSCCNGAQFQKEAQRPGLEMRIYGVDAGFTGSASVHLGLRSKTIQLGALGYHPLVQDWSNDAKDEPQNSLCVAAEVQQYTVITIIGFRDASKCTVLGTHWFKTDLPIQKVRFRIVPVWHQRCNSHGILSPHSIKGCANTPYIRNDVGCLSNPVLRALLSMISQTNVWKWAGPQMHSYKGPKLKRRKVWARWFGITRYRWTIGLVG